MHWSRLLLLQTLILQTNTNTKTIIYSQLNLYELSLNACFDLLLVSLASNKSQQHMSSQRRSEPDPAHWETVGLEPGQITISPHLLLSYYWLSESQRVIITGVTWRPAHTCTKHTGWLPKLSGEYVIKTILYLPSSPSFLLFLSCKIYKEDEGIYFSHTKDRMWVYYKFDNKIFITKIKCG